MKIRSITVFDDFALDLDIERLATLGQLAREASVAFTDAGFEVQTQRLALNMGAKLEALSPEQLPGWTRTLEARCQDHGFGYVALGPLSANVLPHLPAMLSVTSSVFATAQIIEPTTGAIDGEVIRLSAEVIRAAAEIENGFGNLRFGALARVPAYTPFFPGAFHGQGGTAFALATESADLAVSVCQSATTMQQAHDALIEVVELHADRMVAVAEPFARNHGLAFQGIDFSLAPFPSDACSIGGALEALSGQPLGSPGTLAAAATLTDALDNARFPHAGFCGMMMPVLEDSVMARRSAEGRLELGALLQWSAVCGTGLDTVPVPGDTSQAAIERILWDVAALSARLHKPLTARLMPLPGLQAGDAVHFDFAFFADGGVLAVSDASGSGPMTRSERLDLHLRQPRP